MYLGCQCLRQRISCSFWPVVATQGVTVAFTDLASTSIFKPTFLLFVSTHSESSTLCGTQDFTLLEQRPWAQNSGFSLSQIRAGPRQLLWEVSWLSPLLLPVLLESTDCFNLEF